MNIGYLYSLSTQKLVGTIGHSDTHFVYYTEDDLLKHYIELILICNNVTSVYEKLDDIIYYELTNLTQKNFLLGVNFLLPWPYHIKKVEYKDIDYRNIYHLYMKECEIRIDEIKEENSQ